VTEDQERRRSAPAVENRIGRRPEADVGAFGLYCVIAREAREQWIAIDKTESLASIAEFFKTFCARRNLV
jgi:hypothetical protein